MIRRTKSTAHKEEAKPALAPKLRFPEFRETEGWGRKKVGSMLIESPRPIELEDEVEYCLVTVKRRYGGLVSRGNLKGNEIKVNSQFLVHGGDFLISKRQIVHDACGLVPAALDGSVVSNEYSVLTPRAGCSIEFFNWFAQQPCVSRSFSECSVGIVIEKMLFKLPSWLNREFLFPPLPEQQKIASCLGAVDELMAAQARKVDALKIHKKGLMQQLFPREGETQPRLRFPEFQNAGEWREGKLLSLSSEPLSNGVFNDPKKFGSGYKLINVSDMYIETTIDERRLSLLELSPSDFAANQVITGDIFFTRSSLVKSGIAVSNIYLGSSNDVTYDGHLIRFRPSTSKVVPLFAHYLFKTELIRAQLIARGKTATMTTIGQADVASVTLFCPEKTEQQRIATCLSSLDALITAETQKLEALKTHKKGLMQQLFPSPDEQNTL